MRAPRLLRFIERKTAGIEPLVGALHRPVRAFMERHPQLRAALDGTFFGHPLHPAVVVMPIGAWSTGVALDYIGIFGKTCAYTRAADLAIGLGLSGVGLAVLTGLTEWSYLTGKPRRVAFVHASVNMLSAGLFGGSLLLRIMGHRNAGIALSTLGYGAVGLGGWLGGELAYHYGAGVGRIQRRTSAKKGDLV